MRNIIAVPLLGLAVILQSTVVAQFVLLAGTADLVLVILVAWAMQEGVTTAIHWAFLAAVMVSLVTHMPWYLFMTGYLGTVILALSLQTRVWQAPLLAMLTVTFLGSIFMHLLSYLYLRFLGDPISFADSLGLITLPSVLLNLLLAIPLFGMMRDLARWVFPTMEVA